jgi:hypothetical protein
MRVGLLKWSTFNAALLSGAALIFAAPASADQTDDAFVGALQKNGIAFTDPGAAIAAGHSVCAGLDKGQTPALMMLALVKNTNLSPKESGYVVRQSVTSYCPQHKPQVQTSTPS